MNLPINTANKKLVVVVPAAGVGKRMQANCPKQYLTINNKSILVHTVERLLSHGMINKVIIALGEKDEYFEETGLSLLEKVEVVVGGKERVDSVLAGLAAIDEKKYDWVLVHDAARPCVKLSDIDALIQACLKKQVGGLLASPVRDTMKRSDTSQFVSSTECRENLWHALTPQMYPVLDLKQAIIQGIENKIAITDESSAIEAYGLSSQLIEASNENIKITRPDDLAMASFILTEQNKKARSNGDE